jgi:hypothetical protein
MHVRRVILAGFFVSGKLIWAQTDVNAPVTAVKSVMLAGVEAVAPSPSLGVLPAAAGPVSVPLNNDRIFKIIPDYQTVQNSNGNIAPLTTREKWNLAWKETVDPFNFANAAVGALWSQATNSMPRYGRSGPALGERCGAALADFSSQNFLSTGLFASVLHQDPRYFRKGPSAGFWTRVGASLKQIVIARNDSGREVINGSNFLGMAAGIGVSNLYYPSDSRRGSVMLGRVFTGITGDAMGNLMSEFWPDLRKKLFHKKQR